MKDKKYISNIEGKCPVCGHQDLNYLDSDVEGGAMYYHWQCRNCQEEGEEWFSLNFIGHTVFKVEKDEDGGEYWDYDDVNDYISPEGA